MYDNMHQPGTLIILKIIFLAIISEKFIVGILYIPVNPICLIQMSALMDTAWKKHTCMFLQSSLNKCWMNEWMQVSAEAQRMGPTFSYSGIPVMLTLSNYIISYHIISYHIISYTEKTPPLGTTEVVILISWFRLSFRILHSAQGTQIKIWT